MPGSRTATLIGSRVVLPVLQGCTWCSRAGLLIDGRTQGVADADMIAANQSFHPHAAALSGIESIVRAWAAAGRLSGM